MTSDATDSAASASTVAYGSRVWRGTLFKFDSPLPDESLWGFESRLDQMNGARAGATHRLVTQYGLSEVAAGNRAASQYVGTTTDFVGLARLVNLTADEVERLTFRRQLRGLYGPEVHARSLGVAPPFQVCPACLRERWLIKLEFTLPGIDTCVDHGTALVRACTCGRPLRPWSATYRGGPFACTSCRAGFVSLPQREVSDSHRSSQRRLLHTYNVLLEGGSPRFLQAARVLALFAAEPRWYSGFYPDSVYGHVAAARRATQMSLASLVQFFVWLQIAPERVAELPSIIPSRVGPCLHKGCPSYGTDRWVRLLAARHRGWDRYCLACGSRFIGDRIAVSYFLDHGDPRLSECAVRMSSARLAGWLQALVEACCRDPGRARTPSELFEDAGIPRHPNLMSRALGLVQILDDHDNGKTRWRYPGSRGAHATFEGVPSSTTTSREPQTKDR